MALLVALGGCGSGNPSTSAPTESAGDGLLLSSSALPTGATATARVPELCGRSAAILASDGGKTTSSPAFSIDGTTVEETVGVFPAVGSATAGFFGLISEARDRCIQRALGALYSGDGKVSKPSWHGLEMVEGESLRRYLVGSKPAAELDLYVLQSGSCVASILASNGHGEASRPQVHAAAVAAIGRIKAAPACDG